MSRGPGARLDEPAFGASQDRVGRGGPEEGGGPEPAGRRLDLACAAGRTVLWDWNVLTGDLAWSDNVDAMLGYPPEGLPRTLQAWESLLHPEDRTRVLEVLGRHLQDADPYEIDYRVRRQDGSDLWWHVVGDSERDPEGRATRMFGACSDVTEARRAQESLRRLEWMLQPRPTPQADPLPEYGDLVPLATSRVILEAVGADTLRDIVADYLDLLDTSAAVYETNGDYALGLFSSAWCRFMDRASRCLCGTGDNREALRSGCWLCHESCWTRASKVAVETGEPVDIECDGGIRLYAVPIRAGGEIVGSINLGYGDPPKEPGKLAELAERYGVGVADLARQAAVYESRPPFVVDLARRRLESSARLVGEIVERRRAEQVTARSREELKAILDNLPDIAWLKDAEGRFLAVNEPFARACARKASEVVGRTDFDLWPPDLADHYRADDAEVMASRTGKRIEERLVDASGRTTWVDTIKSPILDEQGRVVGTTGLARDVTERRQAQEEIRRLNADLERRVDERTAELRAALEELEAFAYSVSHDLRAPLRAISGFADILVQEQGPRLDDEGRRLMGVITRNVARMGTLIDDLLAFSRTGRAEMRMGSCDLDDLAEGVVAELRGLEPQERRLQVDIGSLGTVRGDPSMVRQALVNLVANALKFTGPNPDPRVRLEARRDGAGQVRVAVSDNGVGFDMRYVDRLFRVFERLHRSDEFPGTGIGLALVKRIAERHGGRVGAEGQPGGGATFWFTLPADPGLPGS